MSRPNNDSDLPDLGCGVLTVKYLVFLFNLLFFISGLVFIIIGGITQGFFKEYVQFLENEYATPAIGIIILGVIILFISFFGCCGAKMENTCMLKTFSFLLGFLLLCEIAAAISIAVLKSEIEDVVEQNMNLTMNQYNDNNTLMENTWDRMQMKLHCCGTDGFEDWNRTNFSNGTDVPDSCCINETTGCGKGALVKENPQIFIKGCAEALKNSSLHNFNAIVGSAVGFAVVQIIGIMMSMCLVRSLKQQYEML